jgi:hypothetical protein
MKRLTFGLLFIGLTALLSMVVNAQPGGQGNYGGNCRTGENDTLRVEITITGTVITVQDTSICNGVKYYLDTDGDGVGDYLLGFGPFWYSPTGITRPIAGTTITVVGFLNNNNTPPHIRVYTIDGNIWRDSTSGPPAWKGGWVGQHGKGLRARDSSRCIFPDSGWGFGRGTGRMGRGWQDSVHTRFDTCQAPFWQGTTPMKGWNITVSSAKGSLLMGDGTGTSYVSFNSPVTLELSYSDIAYSDENTVVPYYFDGTAWKEVADYTVDTENKRVVFTQNPIYEFYGITASSVTSIDDKVTAIDRMVLDQNYPNPFNPTTTIPFTLQQAGIVQLTVYNAAGAVVNTIVDGYMNAGTYALPFDATSMESGQYFYRLTANGVYQTRAMTLLK